MSHLRTKRWLTAPPPRVSVTLLCVTIAALWFPSLTASFQFDDWNVIVGDARVHSFAAWWTSMPGIRPLLKLSYAFSYTMSDQPRGFRLFNIVVHALNSLLVAALFFIKTRQLRCAPAAARWAALLTALMFAMHPVQTEAVTYISGRSSSLSAMFMLLCLLAWARSEAADGTRTQYGWLALSCTALLLATATKETAVVAPLLLWLWSVSAPGATRFPQRLWIPAVTAASVSAIALAMPTYQRLLHFSLDIRSMRENLFTQAHALLYLLGQMLRVDNMNIDPQLVTVNRLDVFTFALLLLWPMLIGWALWRVREASAAAFAILWFAICLLPTNTLLPRLDAANDRQLYLAMIGPAWLLCLRMIELQARAVLAGRVVIALVLALLACSTVLRNRDYATEISLWQVTAAQNPTSSRAANNLGMAYAVACKPQRAAREFSRAIALDRNDYHARVNLNLLLANELPGGCN